MGKHKHVYNWNPDKKDPRDYLYARRHIVTDDTEVPTAGGVEALMPDAIDQGQTGDCTLASTVGGLYKFLMLKALRAGVSSPEVFTPGEADILSLYFAYWNERDAEGNTGSDAGGQIRDAMKALAAFGTCRAVTWPDDPAMLTVKPSDAAYAEAAPHKISVYSKLLSPTDIMHCLASAYPACFGFMVGQSFEDDYVEQNGVWVPQKGEPVVGGHAVTICAYDQQKVMEGITGWGLIQNSWGASWGLQGRVWMPLSFLFDPDQCTDYWTARK
jgi:hypothetical protein